MSEKSPTLARRTLGRRMKRLREERKESPNQLAAAIGYNRKTIVRIEKGEQGTKQPQLEAIARYFEISDEERSYWHSLRIKGDERGWWEPYFDHGSKTTSSPSFPLFLEAEQHATYIRNVELEVIPGLLQTPEYVRELHLAQPIFNESAALASINLRLRRQEILHAKPESPYLEFLINPSAIHFLRQLPGTVADGQIAHLRKINRLPNIDIRVPNSLRHTTNYGNFCVIATEDDSTGLVYIDALDGCRYVEQPDIVSLYGTAFGTAFNGSIRLEEHLNAQT